MPSLATMVQEAQLRVRIGLSWEPSESVGGLIRYWRAEWAIVEIFNRMDLYWYQSVERAIISKIGGGVSMGVRIGE